MGKDTKQVDPAMTSPILKCEGHAGLPKYVFILSLENRSFDHLFGRSGITGTDVTTGQPRGVNGVLLPGETDPNKIDPKYSNWYNGKEYKIPAVDAPYVMTGDPKHEFEHIFCQTAGPMKNIDFFKAYGAKPDTDGYKTLSNDYYDAKIPPPPMSNPHAQTDFPWPVPDMSGFVHSYVRSYSKNEIEKADNYPDTAAVCPDPSDVMKCYNTPSQLKVLYGLAKNYLLCDNFFCSLPGPTGPNRFFMMTGESGGFDGGPTSGDMTKWTTGWHVPSKSSIFKELSRLGVKWRVYSDDNFPMSCVAEGANVLGPNSNRYDIYKGANLGSLQSELRDATDKKPFPFNFCWIEPDYDVLSSKGNMVEKAGVVSPLAGVIGHFMGHPMYRNGNSMHPCSDVTRAEQLILDIYSWISGNTSVWENCVFIITWDEHGGFYDHVVPPTAAPPIPGQVGRTWRFKFDRFGCRVPCLVISPFLKSNNLVDGTVYDHGSILKTVVDLYNKGAFNDGKAPSAWPYWTDRILMANSMIGLISNASSKVQTAAIDPPNPSAELAANNLDYSSADMPKGGNIPLFVAAAMNTQKSVDPSFDGQQALASLTSYDALASFWSRAESAYDSHMQSQAPEQDNTNTAVA